MSHDWIIDHQSHCEHCTEIEANTEIPEADKWGIYEECAIDLAMGMAERGDE